jgi:gamma-glutamyltranspeptidase
VDAAIASAICDGVLNCHSMGIGGGFLMLIYQKSNRKMTVVDARETAPKNSFEEMYVQNPLLALKGKTTVFKPKAFHLNLSKFDLSSLFRRPRSSNTR